MSEIYDQCRTCTVRGNRDKCSLATCSYHNSWYAIDLRQQLAEAIARAEAAEDEAATITEAAAKGGSVNGLHAILQRQRSEDH
jgi:hypothetical protein